MCVWVHAYVCVCLSVCVCVCVCVNRLVFYAQSTSVVISGRCVCMHVCLCVPEKDQIQTFPSRESSSSE